MALKRILGLCLCLMLVFAVVAGCTPQPTPPAGDQGTTPPDTQGSEAPKTFEESIAWDGEYDVIVAGYGAAGAVTSITAADEGAKVLLAEKAPMGEEGGNSRFAAQIILAPTDREKAITYFKAMRGGFDNQSDAIIEVIVDGAMQVPDWLKSMGATEVNPFPLIEYPELPGSDGIGTVIIGKEIMTSKFYQLLQKNVAEREDNIDVWYASPAMELIQDPATKIVHGVKVQRDGKLLNIRAKNGVVLCTGGFENNEEMAENYVQLPYVYSKGAKYNDGDGIKMAMRIGADLWHMSALSGPDVNFKAPERPIAFGYYMQSAHAMISVGATGFAANGVIFVGEDGARFTNETEAPRHGHVSISGTWFSMPIPTPAYCVFDEEARLAAPIYPTWSKDNSAEIEKGWITKADTIEELETKLNMAAGSLKNEIDRYNQYCAGGVDMEFGRAAEFLKPLAGKGPYYAMELSPSYTNTQGGPKRNENGQIVDVDGNPIPHLYSAGELGSVYADIYNGGGNLSECIFFGRISGKNAAAVKTDVSSASVMEGKTPAFSGSDKFEMPQAEGKLVGMGMGIGGPLVVGVTMEGDKIAEIQYLYIHETVGISDGALVEVPKKIIETQSTEVDTVSGATVTSRAIMEAVKDALSKK